MRLDCGDCDGLPGKTGSIEHGFTAKAARRFLSFEPMSLKYYTHFIAHLKGAMEYSEYRGVVELLGESGCVQKDREIARVLANSFDLEENDIQVLQWDQVH